MRPLLSTSGLGFQIARRWLFKDLDLALHAGECLGVLGPNGAGKTSLLHTLAGLKTAARGSISITLGDLQQLDRRQIARQIGLLFQDLDQQFPTTVFEAALNGRHPHLGAFGMESADDLALAADALHQVGLSQMLDRPVQSLSGGEQRLLGIATLLTQGPEIALLDEPSNHLDLGRQIRTLSLVRDIFTGKGKALIMTLHDINLATRFCDRLLLLSGNGDWTLGRTREVATPERLSPLYGHPLRLIDTTDGGRVLIPA